MTRIVILTGDELRHRYFRIRMSLDPRFDVVLSVCEGIEKSLGARTRARADASPLERWHAEARDQAETDFFAEVAGHLPDESHPRQIPKGAINSPDVVALVTDAAPDLILCYGASIVRGPLLDRFVGRFLNVHLGLSPWYRGSGTNVWPLIEGKPHMVGATFMHIDAGIDTGHILHQIRAGIALGDSPHSIGNRLIRDMTGCYADLAAHFGSLDDPSQPDPEQGRLYRQAEFDAEACARLYRNFRDGMIESHLSGSDRAQPAPLVRNRTLESLA
ncbi:formyltransferase family protein [Salibaculum sp.]|uniref:formyltransferase family protein n=1 Tax=Salibaculum sp. TaxID=2855480 RepID=UPI002B474FC5|nr:formyltransferase family protein [Salibaculum sp.]HKL69593.1 formyltransferase family protein [Salibaculum sp.]